MNSGVFKNLLALLATLALTAGVTTASAGSAQAVDPSAAPSAKAAAPYKIKPFKPRKNDNARLVKNWRKWKKHRYVAYTTKVKQSCFCLRRPAIRTRVKKKRVISVRYQGQTRQLARKGYEMDALYRLLRKGYRKADDVRVRYRAGVPVEISIDWDRMIADEETFLRVRVKNAAVKGRLVN